MKTKLIRNRTNAEDYKLGQRYTKKETNIWRDKLKQIYT